MDELAHIPAGYGYVKYLDYRLNPEHPPLIKALSAIPLLFMNLKFPTESNAWQKDINGQWEAGNLFIYNSVNNADQIVNWARLAPMILTLLLVLMVYVWSKELLGEWWALLPSFLTALSPNFLAHSHYVTTDVGAALGFFISIYYFVKFFENRSSKNLLLAGVAFGIAQLMKFSTVLLIPLFLFLIFFFAIAKTRNFNYGFIAKLIGFLGNFFRYLGYLIAIFLIGLIAIYIMYFVFTLNYPVEKQISDTEFTLTSFSGGPDPSWQTCKISDSGQNIGISRRIRCLANINIWMAGNKILRPIGQYILGILMVMQRSSGGNTGYFLGEVSASGWWYYFPVVFLIKEPLPSLLIIAIAILAACGKFFKNFWRGKLSERFFNYLELNFAEFSMLSFVVLYWAYSIKSPLNIGVRHILPTVPFIYILSTQAIKNWTRYRVYESEHPVKKFILQIYGALKNSFKTSLIVALLFWFFLETAFGAPYFISYFNEFGGGTMGGYKYVTDSNYDWGQDLKRLKDFVEQKNIDKIAVDYFGGGDVKYYLGQKAENWQSSKGNPKFENINWVAISINNLSGALGKLHLGQKRNPEDEYSWLVKIKDPYNPDYHVGTSIFVYKLQ